MRSPCSAICVATHSRSGAKPSLAAYCNASRGVSHRTIVVASRIASIGKLSGDGNPPASEMIPGRSVILRISGMTDGFIRSARRAMRHGVDGTWAALSATDAVGDFAAAMPVDDDVDGAFLTIEFITTSWVAIGWN